MPGAVLSRVVRRLAALATAALLAGVPGLAAAQSQSAELSIGVPKGKVKSVRLRHLPLGTSLVVVIAASGSLRVALVSEREAETPTARPIFSGALERTMSFKVVIPQTGDYYLVLDNRRGADDVSAKAAVRAERGPAQPPSPQQPKGKGQERASLARPAVT